VLLRGLPTDLIVGLPPKNGGEGLLAWRVNYVPCFFCSKSQTDYEQRVTKQAGEMAMK
jgi:hypothetical protein